MRARAFLVVLLVAFVSTAVTTADDAYLTAPEVLERMREAYAGCSTYHDEGLVAIKFDSSEDAWTSRKPFSVVFVRDGLGAADEEASGAKAGQTVRMRYEFWHQSGNKERSPWNHYVVWSDGVGIRSWWSLKGAEENHDSWDEALSGPSGVSGTSAMQTTSLLLAGDTTSCLWKEPHNASVVGQETIDDRPTYKIEMLNSCGDQRVVWIDLESFLLRQMTFDHQFDWGETQTTIRFQPVMDGPLDASLFRFEPDADRTEPPAKWRSETTLLQ